MVPPHNSSQSLQDSCFIASKYKNLSEPIIQIASKSPNIPSSAQKDGKVHNRRKQTIQSEAIQLRMETTRKLKQLQFETLKVDFDALNLLLNDLEREMGCMAKFCSPEYGDFIGIVWSERNIDSCSEQGRARLVSKILEIGEGAIDAVVLIH
ncbi:MAG: hypothetical protein EZS28_041770 [Streblomastix strix]|uniref:Uncharacterized protein n=1 Tax=Streblomastix strix TaxID=222440 RepID=A0A5J4TWN3_9EUKA|nr:MAG: hypothetical protein EZS28_041770 [Streblomastix strix]